MKPLHDWTLVTCALLLIGCALFEPKEATYLRSVQDHANQEEIRQQLGQPHLTKRLEAGGAVWVYQFFEQEYGDRIRASGTWCDEYALTFDSHAVLRHWTRQTRRHGGELAPTYCVAGGFTPRS